MSPAEPVPTVREVEHKFRVHGLYRVPDMTRADVVTDVEDHGIVELETVYYDTPDLRLIREGMNLRRRTGGPDEGWHLKIKVPEAAEEVRDELRLPLDAGEPQAPPSELLDLVCAVVRHSLVHPVVTLRTTRHVRHVLDADGRPAAELVDDTVQVINGSGQASAQFRELELSGAPPELVDHVVTQLDQSGAVSGEFISKPVRALGTRAVAAPEVPEPDEVGADEPASAAVQAFIALHTRALRAADLVFRRDPDGPWDAVHKMRVAARRLRSGLRVFRPLLDREWADELRDELRWAAQGLGELRELDVLIARLEERMAALPDDAVPEDPTVTVLGRTRERQKEARARVAVLLSSDRYIDLHERLVVAAAKPAFTEAAAAPASEALPPLVRKAWKRLAKRAKAVLDDESALPGGAPDDEWHQARIAAKRARYAGEAVAPVLGAEAKAFAEQMERVTEILGEHQDAADAGAAIQAMAANADAPASFTLGVLYAAEREGVTATRREFARLWPKVSRPKWRRWLAT
ncbi:MAG TPA: CYTH and CHAD domain-containing protein [Jiangellaceae bacterium]|nr:CYTH and CHAD domain-containing protein [Jiangellaceae bacterium]